MQPLKGIALGVNHAVVDSLRQAATADLDGPAWDEAQVEVETWMAGAVRSGRSAFGPCGQAVSIIARGQAQTHRCWWAERRPEKCILAIWS